MSRAEAVVRCSPMSRSFSVHPKYIEEVNLVWKRKSDGREQEIAEQLGHSLCLVVNNLFLKGEPVNRVNFIEICQFLGLNWQEMVGPDVQESPVSSQPAKATSRKAQTPVSFNAVAPPEELAVGTLGTSELARPTPANLPPKGNAPQKAIALSTVPVDVKTVEEAINALAGTLCEMLRRLTRKAGDFLRADRTSIFLLDQERKELGSLIADDGSGGCLIIEIPLGKGFVSLAATSSKVINVPFDLYHDPHSEAAKQTDKKTGYRTYTILACPLLNKQNDVVAVVQFINKLKPNYNPEDELSKRIDTKGFTQEDEAQFAKFVPSIQKILERCQLCYELTLRLRKKAGFNKGGIDLQNAALVAELKRQEQQLRHSLDKMEQSPRESSS